MSIHDAEAERAILGCVLAGESPELARVLTPGDFFDVRHRAVWTAMLALLAAGQPIDELTVVDRLKAAGQLAECGGPAWVMGLASTAPISANLESYIRIARDRTLRRAMEAQARRLAELAKALSADPQAAALQASAALATLGSSGATELPTMEKAYGELLEELDAINKGLAVGAVPTGIDVWDELIGGLPLGYLTCIGAYPSVGKSALKNRMLINIASAGFNVGTFELEDPAKAVARRALARDTGIPVRRLRERLPDYLFASVGSAVERAYSTWASRVVYQERSGMTDAQVAATARQMVIQRGCKVIFVDHAGEMQWTAETGRMDSDMERGLQSIRDVAKDLNVAVVVLAHFHRPKSATDKEPRFMRPTSSLWKNSGGYEQMARVAVGLWLAEGLPGQVLATCLKQMEGKKDFDFAMPLHESSGLIESEGGRAREGTQGYSEGDA